MALPNPQGKLIDNTGKQVITLGSLLQVQEDVEKWSQNTDINTFRTGVESQKGFNDLKESLSESGAVAQTLKKNVIEPGKSIDQATEEVKEGLGGMDAFLRVIRVATKPFAAIGKNLSDVKFSEIGPSFFSVTQASERINTGFKELTNGIGELGPMFNTLKTQTFKVVAGFNVLLGIFQFLGTGIAAIFKATKRLTKKELDQGEKDRAKITLGKDKGEKGEEYRKTLEEKEKLEEEGENLEMDDVKVMFIDGTTSYFENMRRAFGLAMEDAGFLVATAPGNDAHGDAKKTAKQKYEEEHAENLLNQQKKQRKINKLLNEERKKNESGYFKFRTMQEVKFQMVRFAKVLLPALLLIGGALKVFDILKSSFQDFATAPFAGLTAGFDKALNSVGTSFKELFKSLKNFLAKLFPKMFAPTVPKPNPSTKTPGQTPKPTNALKTVGKNVLKRIPIVGGVVEGGVDAGVNEMKFNKIKKAYENNESIIQDEETGELRPLTPEEFEAAQKSMTANRVGTAGRTVGAMGGAAAGAAAGAAIGSVIPVVGTAIGGIIGGVLGGFFGGRKGDEIATNLANQAEGIDDPQEYINMLSQNVPELQNEAGAELAGAQGEVADATLAAGGGGGMNNQQFNQTDNSSSNTFNGSEIPVSDQQADYSYA